MTPSFNRRRANLPLWAFILLLLVILLAGIGWFLNIIKLVGLAMAADPNVIMGMVRAVGIIFAPLGAVMGWL